MACTHSPNEWQFNILSIGTKIGPKMSPNLEAHIAATYTVNPGYKINFLVVSRSMVVSKKLDMQYVKEI